jgi:hypothetical protein
MKQSEKRVNFRLAVPAQYQPCLKIYCNCLLHPLCPDERWHVQYIANTGMCTYVHSTIEFSPNRNQIRYETGSDLFVNDLTISREGLCESKKFSY